MGIPFLSSICSLPQYFLFAKLHHLTSAVGILISHIGIYNICKTLIRKIKDTNQSIGESKSKSTTDEKYNLVIVRITKILRDIIRTAIPAGMGSIIFGTVNWATEKSAYFAVFMCCLAVGIGFNDLMQTMVSVKKKLSKNKKSKNKTFPSSATTPVDFKIKIVPI